jgi:hypothetical protein
MRSSGFKKAVRTREAPHVVGDVDVDVDVDVVVDGDVDGDGDVDDQRRGAR